MDATVLQVLLIVRQAEESAIVTLNGEEARIDKTLIELVTSKENPLCVSSFIVYYIINEGRVRSVEYEYCCKLYTFIKMELRINDGVAKHKGIVIKSNPNLIKLPTSLQEPLWIRQKSKYINLPVACDCNL